MISGEILGFQCLVPGHMGSGRPKLELADLLVSVVTFQALLPALKDVSLVFHCASPAPASDDRRLFERVNIQGTRTVLQACMDVGVQVRHCEGSRGCNFIFLLFL